MNNNCATTWCERDHSTDNDADELTLHAAGGKFFELTISEAPGRDTSAPMLDAVAAWELTDVGDMRAAGEELARLTTLAASL